ncbi:MULTISPECIES: hypothetical protein [unclassified Marinobacterium]|uniref:hypothetical protein n=1 Tax=unclassified Marinobacterium TaxID=2644139 RepID=UPI001568973D|nr:MULTISPECIES: hypothetical protein [unclassified Marinobacterium]NRP10999.1 hypothetical protein [Marinobacterium sp. xm-g-48]NRP83843.1 hypothetical protein [Marinobacterium sp. xm-d-509]
MKTFGFGENLVNLKNINVNDDKNIMAFELILDGENLGLFCSFFDEIDVGKIQSAADGSDISDYPESEKISDYCKANGIDLSNLCERVSEELCAVIR